ncbi:unnamed protein product [Rotaria magnacalcarata]
MDFDNDEKIQFQSLTYLSDIEDSTLRLLYEQADPAPAFHLINTYRDNESKLHHQESIYVSNAISSSQACLIQQSSEEQQYRSSQDFISHCGDYESVARIQLNHRKKEEDKKAAVSTKPSAPNFMAIMEQAAKYGRDKIHPQSESENNDESSQWNDSNCERCEEFERHKNKFKWICCDTTVTTGSEVGGCKNGNMASMKIPQMDNIEMEAILIKRWEEECRRNQEYNERWLLLLENRIEVDINYNCK